MSLTLIDVFDSVIKIGLGSAITAISGYFVLKKTYSHEESKELKNRYYSSQEERKSKFIEFLSQSQNLVQNYLHTCCNCQSDDYLEYLRSYSEVQIISQDNIRVEAHKLMSAVNVFITFDHSRDTDQSQKMREEINDHLGIFQKLAQDDVTKIYTEKNINSSNIFENLKSKICNITSG